MKNIIDYLKSNYPHNTWNEIDELILARLSYIPFDLLDFNYINIRQASHFLLEEKDLIHHVHAKEDIQLLEALENNYAFNDLRLSDYVNIFSEEEQAQFSAITIRLEDDLYCISFRGTDNSIIGWKENFNMGFQFPVPSQSYAFDYLQKISQQFNGRFMITGHSKGGNLAMYAGIFSTEDIQKRILSVYNFDGGGFDENLIMQVKDLSIYDRITTYIPQSSIVGLLLEHPEMNIVIKSSRAIDYLQHDLYSWSVINDHLERQKHLTNTSRLIHNSLNQWIHEMDLNKRKEFINTSYEILHKTNTKSLKEFDQNWFVNTKIILKSLQALGKRRRALLIDSVTSLMEKTKESFVSLMKSSLLHDQR